jgi:hypothetical protein
VVHVAAQHRSLPIAAYLTYALSHLSVQNKLLDRVGGMFAERGKTVRIRRCCTGREFFSLHQRSPKIGRSVAGTQSSSDRDN